MFVQLLNHCVSLSAMCMYMYVSDVSVNVLDAFPKEKLCPISPHVYVAMVAVDTECVCVNVGV